MWTLTLSTNVTRKLVLGRFGLDLLLTLAHGRTFLLAWSFG